MPSRAACARMPAAPCKTRPLVERTRAHAFPACAILVAPTCRQAVSRHRGRQTCPLHHRVRCRPRSPCRHTSLATSAFADSASEALAAARASTHGVPDSLLRMVLENEKVSNRHRHLKRKQQSQRARKTRSAALLVYLWEHLTMMKTEKISPEALLQLLLSQMQVVRRRRPTVDSDRALVLCITITVKLKRELELLGKSKSQTRRKRRAM